jgi:hypothetical protein
MMESACGGIPACGDSQWPGVKRAARAGRRPAVGESAGVGTSVVAARAGSGPAARDCPQRSMVTAFAGVRTRAEPVRGRDGRCRAAGRAGRWRPARYRLRADRDALDLVARADLTLFEDRIERWLAMRVQRGHARLLEAHADVEARYTRLRHLELVWSDVRGLRGPVCQVHRCEPNRRIGELTEGDDRAGDGCLTAAVRPARRRWPIRHGRRLSPTP